MEQSRFKQCATACLVLTAAVLIAFWPSLSNGFTNYDDETYVTDNPHIQDGITADSLKWAISSEYASNWHPLTWMSHMLDMEMFGHDPSGHHATSLLLHLVNTLLLFLLLHYLTGSISRAAAVAALFGVHPLHVESVVWIAERKDVLSTTFWFLSTLAYARYAKNSCSRSYRLSVLLLALGLCAKPMLVTLPFTLLLLDFWPLGRWPGREERKGRFSFPWHLLREKIPMFALAAASSAITMHAQMTGGAVRLLQEVPIAARITNVAVSYATYLGKTLWPTDLAVFYPHQLGSLRASSAMLAFLLLLAITALAIRYGFRRPYIPVGWFWFLGTLVPVLGLVQVGSQSMADRYTYMPLIGIFVVLAWGAPEALKLLPVSGKRESRSAHMPGLLALTFFWLLLVPIMISATRIQAGYWRDSRMLFEHALNVTDNNALAHHNLGDALLEAGETEDAIEQYEAAIRIEPGFALPHNSLCFALNELRRFDEAVDSCSTAIEHDPEYAEPWNNRSLAYAKMGRLQDAFDGFEAAIRLEPEYAEAHNNLGATLRQFGRASEAVRHLERAIELNPEYPEAFNTLAMIALDAGRADDTIRHCTRALELRPDYPEALCNLGGALTIKGDVDQALQYLDHAIQLRPGYGKAYSNRAVALYMKGERFAAQNALQSALRFGFEPPRRLVDLLSTPEP